MPISAANEEKARGYAHIFGDSSRQLLAYLDSHQIGFTSGDIQHAPADLSHRDKLVKKVHYNLMLAQGFLGERDYLLEEGNQEAAENRVSRAEHHLTLTVIYANAVRKANFDGKKILSRKVHDAAAHSIDKAIHLAADRHRFDPLENHFAIAESNHWQRRDGDTRLMQIIGATWCGDTARIMEITASFVIPVHYLNMYREGEWIEDEVEERVENEKGFLKHLDHAFFVIKPDDAESRLPVPVIIFPNQDTLVEPDSDQFVIALVEHGLL
jgi:hypothetical protein